MAGWRMEKGVLACDLVTAWGREARRRATRGFDGFSGLHAECLPWLAEREVSVLGSDGISDPMPFVGTPQWPFPVHQIGIVSMGLYPAWVTTLVDGSVQPIVNNLLR